ncbi:hypothetical protein GWK47_022565 [Chionoecetes opilio]|uniref:Tesmin/TSO1-like CXC domain-containing protein n=1 Tax=Chionoecetes opilio TaxID=41210 RepID=A0A8J4XMR1_CHIOP|nr:hypothetical protein GWK47_022565 [Chionoecetes opilio]
MYTLETRKDASQKGQTIKADRLLFQRLHVAQDSGRDIDLKSLLSHELTPVPLSLADTAGRRRPTNKAALGKILEDGVNVEVVPKSSLKTCFIIAGQALVQAIGKPMGSKSFGDLADVFNASVFSHFNEHSSRVDVVFDRYRITSIKSGTRERREGRVRSIRHKIDSREIRLPANWKQFMDLPENKANLTKFLSDQMMLEVKKNRPTYELITAGGFEEETKVASSQRSDVEQLHSSHEEADTRIILHAKAAYINGYERIIVSCKDTDVLVLLTHFAGQLSEELWMRTGTRQERRYVAVHDIQLTPTMQRNIQVYHAITGCDTVSQPIGHGKKTTWKVFQQHGALLDDLGRGTLSESTIRSVEEFFCRIYSPASDETTIINDVRYRMFQKGTTDQEKLPPCRKCLEQHIKRAHHQAQVWFQADVPIPEIESPIGSGCYEGCYEETTPTHQYGRSSANEVTGIVCCKCKNCATSRCSCRAKNLKCIAACTCNNGVCHNPYSVAIEPDSK